MRRVPWDDLRAHLGTNRDRLGALRLMSAATGYEPMPHQLRAHLADGDGGITSKLFLAGIGSGKTVFAMAEAVILSILNPGTVSAVTAPTYDQVSNVLLPIFMDFSDKMAKAGYPLVRRFIRSMLEAELVCGGKICWRSFGKVDNLRGYSISHLVADETEAHSAPGYVWDVLSGRLRSPRANILQATATTTPRGLRGVPAIFVAARRAAEAIEDPAERIRALRRWFTIRASSMENPHLPDGYLESLKATYSHRQWEQEVHGRILQSSAAVWSEFDPMRHARPWTFEPSLPYSVSIDFGATYPHALWIQQTMDGAWIVFDEMCDDNVPPLHLRRIVTEKAKALGREPEHLVGDRAVPTELAYFQQVFGGTYVHRMKSRREQSVSQGIEAVRSCLDPIVGPPTLYLSDKLTKSRERRALVRCMENYRYKMRSDGTVDEDHPWKDNVHDHGADALRMFAVAVITGRDRAVRKIGKRQHGSANHSRRDRGWGFRH